MKEIKFDGKRYENLPIYMMGATRLHEVIAENEEFLLTNYYSSGYFLYVFNKKTLQAVEKKERHSEKKKKDLELFENKIKPYFKDCKELLEKIKFGIENSNYNHKRRVSIVYVYNHLFSLVTNFNCTNGQKKE